MSNKKCDIIIEGLALILVALVLIGTPAVVWWYEKVYLPAQYGPDARIINLTAIATGGIWTEENVAGYNYWWKRFKRAEEVHITAGDRVVLRAKSTDVLHSFAIPRLRLGPFEVYAGKVKEIKFEADRPGRLKYLCWLWCSEDHPRLKGSIVVEE